MKRLFLAIFIVFFIPSMLFADDVDEGLSSNTPLRIKESARQVIQLGIKDQAVIKMTRTMLENNFSQEQVIAGLELLIKTKKQNLSEDPVINKLHEGIAKKVGAENILQAMEKVRSRYEVATTYVQDMKTDAERTRVLTDQMAECMAAGMDKNSINKMMEMLQQKTRNASKDEAYSLNENTLKTARTMARSGVNSKDIVDIVNNAFQRNYNSAEMEKLGNAFMRQVRGPSPASDLAKAYSAAIKNGATADNILVRSTTGELGNTLDDRAPVGSGGLGTTAPGSGPGGAAASGSGIGAPAAPDRGSGGAVAPGNGPGSPAAPGSGSSSGPVKGPEGAGVPPVPGK